MAVMHHHGSWHPFEDKTIGTRKSLRGRGQQPVEKIDWSKPLERLRICSSMEAQCTPRSSDYPPTWFQWRIQAPPSPVELSPWPRGNIRLRETFKQLSSRLQKCYREVHEQVWMRIIDGVRTVSQRQEVVHSSSSSSAHKLYLST